MVLTTACNLACAYCFERRGPARSMPWPVLRRAVELLAASDDPQPVLVLYGGEPLLARDLVERAVRLARELEDRARPISIRLPTNGTLLDLELVDLLAAHRVEVQLSFDGVEAAQVRRSAGSFAPLDRLLRLLSKQRPSFLFDRVLVLMTLSSETVPLLADGVRSLSALGARRVGVTPLYTPDPGWTAATTAALDRELERLRRWCAWQLEEIGRQPFEPLARYREGTEPRPTDPDLVCVVPDGSHVAVDVDGRLAPCLLAAASIAPLPVSPLAEALGHIDRGCLDDPFDEGALASFRAATRAVGLFHGRDRKYSSHGRCADCEHRDDCLPCPLATAWIPANADPNRVPDHLCAFNRTLARHRSLMPPAPTLFERLRGEAPVPRAVARLLARAALRDELPINPIQRQ